MEVKNNHGALFKNRRTPDEPRSVVHCSKPAYQMALFLEQEAEEAGISPNFDLCFLRIREAREAGNMERAAFLEKVRRIMQAREAVAWDAVFILSDE